MKMNWTLKLPLSVYILSISSYVWAGGEDLKPDSIGPLLAVGAAFFIAYVISKVIPTEAPAEEAPVGPEPTLPRTAPSPTLLSREPELQELHRNLRKTLLERMQELNRQSSADPVILPIQTNQLIATLGLCDFRDPNSVQRVIDTQRERRGNLEGVERKVEALHNRAVEFASSAARLAQERAGNKPATPRKPKSRWNPFK